MRPRPDAARGPDRDVRPGPGCAAEAGSGLGGRPAEAGYASVAAARGCVTAVGVLRRGYARQAKLRPGTIMATKSRIYRWTKSVDTRTGPISLFGYLFMGVCLGGFGV